jgi:hypothetical protein
MSGSGSNGGFDSGAGGGRSIDCRNFCFETHIHSPVQAELTNLTVGLVLDVIVSTIGTIEVVQILNNGVVVGGLVDQAPRIKACIENGFNFTATVRSISGAAVKVFVQSI